MNWPALVLGPWLVPLLLWCAFWGWVLWPARRTPDFWRMATALLVVPPLLVAAARVLP
jgi:hypothetical protein